MQLHGLIRDLHGPEPEADGRDLRRGAPAAEGRRAPAAAVGRRRAGVDVDRRGLPRRRSTYLYPRHARVLPPRRPVGRCTERRTRSIDGVERGSDPSGSDIVPTGGTLDDPRGHSSVGRASGWQPEGRRFEPGWLHVKRAVHDRGGWPSDAPIDRSEHELEVWEVLVDSLVGALSVNGVMNVDELRRGIESMPREEYERASYYERWLYSAETILTEKGVLAPGELDA